MPPVLYEVRAPLPQVLQACQEMLARVTDRFPGELLWESLLSECQAGTAQLWVLGQTPEPPYIACLVTRVIKKPAHKVLELTALSTENMETCLAHYGLIEEWGARQGCTEVQLHGRLGWQKALRILGFSPKFLVMSRPIKAPHLNA